ncbi:hypothetical protein EVAR_39994_1 [Eumeta japonica]|uniref:Uncharacterized protein n=1 Tax=Eumeta variegata TaxID=151549 RepID=A0A4C1ZL21_EUMVA|nr:hypothetical protein EVAR_39994_1 [Eumeta japonica]
MDISNPKRSISVLLASWERIEYLTEGVTEGKWNDGGNMRNQCRKRIPAKNRVTSLSSGRCGERSVKRSPPSPAR